MKKLLCLGLMGLLFVGCERGEEGDGDAVGVTGDWSSSLTGSTISMTLDQTGTAVSGSATHGSQSYSISGTAQGAGIALTFSVPSQTQSLVGQEAMYFDGELSGNSLAGSIWVGDDSSYDIVFSRFVASSSSSGSGPSDSGSDEPVVTPVIVQGVAPPAATWNVVLGGTSFTVDVDPDSGTIFGTVNISGADYAVTGALAGLLAGSSMDMTIAATPGGDYVLTGSLTSSTEAGGTSTLNAVAGPSWSATRN